MSDQHSGLEAEMAKYAELEPALLAQGLAGKWIVIFQGVQVAICDDPEDAHRKGVEAAGPETPFLLKEIGGSDVAAFPALTYGLLNAHP